MKKYASLLLFALILNGCDDGDLTVDTIDFDDPTIVAQTCNPLTNTLIYKIKSQESLLIQVPENTFANDATPLNAPIIKDLDNTSYRLVYRAYNGTVAVANICGTIPPTTPSVTEEWQAVAGKMIINSTQISEQNTTDGSTKITGYNYNITFQNVSFSKPSGIQVEIAYPFGDFKTTYTSPTTTFTGPVQQCPDSKQVYSFTPSTALTIDSIDKTLLVNVVTAPNTPRKGLISATTNKVTLRTFNGTLTQGYFCGTTVPSTPSVNETWIAENGVADVSGTIEVTTTNVLNVYTHTIVLRNTKLVKGNSSFKLPTEYTLGKLEVVVPN